MSRLYDLAKKADAARADARKAARAGRGKVERTAPPSVKKAPAALPVPDDVVTVTVAGDEGGLVRLIFPAPAKLAKRIDAEWHGRGYRSRSETIRVLIEKGLK